MASALWGMASKKLRHNCESFILKALAETARAMNNEITSETAATQRESVKE